MHRKAQEISNAQTPSSANTWRQGGPRTAYGTVLHKVKELEKRNAQLTKLLDAAVGDLWEYQKVATESAKPGNTGEGRTSNDSLEQLSVAIAKVQFVQVYLSDSSLPLPTDDAVTDDSQGKEDREELATPQEQPPSMEEQGQINFSPATTHLALEEDPILHAAQNNTELADPSTFDDPDDISVESEPQIESATPAQTDLAIKVDPPSETKATEAPPDLPSPPAARPPLAESSYSWMLGNDDKKDQSDTDGIATRKPASSFFEDQRRNRGFLFGDEDAAKVEEPALKVVHKKGRAHRKAASSASKVADEDAVLGLQDMQVKE